MNNIISYVQNSKINFADIAEFILEDIFGYSGITLNIIENKKKAELFSTDDFEFSAFLEKSPFPNNYILWVKPGALTPTILCHEMWHLKQYQEGRLSVSSDYKKVTFDKKEYDKNTKYSDRPWEIEAFAMKSTLLRQYKKKDKDKKKKCKLLFWK